MNSGKFSKTGRASWLGASLVLCSAASLAAEIETITVTANRVEQDSSHVLSSLSVIDNDAISTVSHTHINELLNRSPGVWITRGNGQEHLTAIRSAVLTGPGSCGAFYIAEDGISLRAPGFCNVNQLFDANTEQAQRIEVLRGPGTAVHGSNALNGVINVITQAPAEELSGRLELEGGPHDYSRVKLGISQGNETHRLGLYANGAHDGGYKDDSGFDQQKLTVRYDYSGETWNSRNVLSGSNLNQETAGYVEGLDAYKDDSLKKSNPNPEAYRDSSSARFYSRWEREGSQNTRFVVTPYLRYTEMAFLQHFLPGTPLEENGQKSAGVQAAFYSQLENNVQLHHGIDVDYTNAYLVETQSDPSFVRFGTGYATGKHYDYQINSTTAAWFLGGTWNPKPIRELTAGIRYEKQRYDYDNKMSDGNGAADGDPAVCGVSPCRFARPADSKDDFYNWSGHVGARENLNDQIALIANFSSGFRTPEATEAYRQQTKIINIDPARLEDQLESERVINSELGLRGNWQALSAKLTAYRLHKDNIILQDDATRERFSDGKTLRRGLELELNWQILESLALGFQGSYAKTVYDNEVLDAEGNEVVGAPRQMASSQLRWKPFTATTTELEWVYVGEHYLDTANTKTYPGHNLVHLRVQQQLHKGLSVAVRVTNLTDEDYAERADYAFGDYRYFIGEPRSTYVSLKLDF